MITAMPLGFGAGWTVRPEFSGLPHPPAPSGALSGQSGSLGGAEGSAAKADAPTKPNNAATIAGRSFQWGCTQEIQPESGSKGNLGMRLVVEIPPATVGFGVLGES